MVMFTSIGCVCGLRCDLCEALGRCCGEGSASGSALESSEVSADDQQRSGRDTKLSPVGQPALRHPAQHRGELRENRPRLIRFEKHTDKTIFSVHMYNLI